ncbi:MAG: DNA polymerase III subunit delta [Pseudomonadota bacterium]
MSDLKRDAIQRFLHSPPSDCIFALIHGPDRGLAQARADSLVDRVLEQRAAGDPMARTVLDEEALKQQPSLLAEEAEAVSMFSSFKVIVARYDDPKPLSPIIASLLANPPTASLIVLLAGNLRKSHPVRKAIETSDVAVAIACYEEDTSELGAVLDSQASAHGLTIDPSVRLALLGRLGRNYAVAVSEIEKLCLYAYDTGSLSPEGVDALLADAADVTANDLIDAAFDGQRERVLKTLAQFFEAGGDAATLLLLARRQAMFLERMRAQVETGASVIQALKSAKPPIFFKREPQVRSALSNWRTSDLRALAKQLDDEIVAARLDPSTSHVRAERSFLRITSVALRRR